LVEGIQAEYWLADKGYDTNWFIELIEQQKAVVVIPPRSNRKVQREYDKQIYKERNLVERFFNRIKNYRRIATRYEKTACSYLGMIFIASILIWLT